jgi:hypothetical protein
MNPSSRPSLTRAAIAAACLAAACAANAAPRLFDLRVTIDDNGTSIANLAYEGSFSFDDATGGGGSPQRFDLTGFAFDFAGSSYGLPDLDDTTPPEAVFDGATPLGLEAVERGAALFAFIAGDGTDAPYFAYDLGQGDAGFGSVKVHERSAAVPEPSAAGLLAAAALAGLCARGLGLRRARSAARHGGLSCARAARAAA